MSTAAQVAANLANAQFSTGPVSDAGKAASSANSLKHGMTAKTILLPGEDETAYRKMCEGMLASFTPADEPEAQLVQFLCDTQWRLQRCGRIEAVILSADVVDFKAFDIMSKHEARLKKQYSATLKEALQLMEGSVTHQEEAMKQAIAIRRSDKNTGKTTDLQKIGFVFSTEEIDARIAAADALARAQKVLNPEKKFKMPDSFSLLCKQ